MSINVACSVPRCTNPVIGQCTGYKKNCGRYYCHEHSSDTLCAECTSRKITDEQAQAVLQDYLHTSEELEKEALSVFNGKTTWQKGLKVVAIIGLIGGPIIFPIFELSNSYGGTPSFWEILSMIGAGFFIGPLYGALGWTIYVFPFVWIWGVVKRGTWHRTKGINRAKEIDSSKQGFYEFYTTWRKEKSKEKLKNVLVVAGVIAAIGLAAAASATSESDYDRTRRAVRDEMNRN
jgi:hypothetical protein